MKVRFARLYLMIRIKSGENLSLDSFPRQANALDLAKFILKFIEVELDMIGDPKYLLCGGVCLTEAELEWVHNIRILSMGQRSWLRILCSLS